MDRKQSDLQLLPFNMASLKAIKKLRGKRDPFKTFWEELEAVLKCKHPKSNKWEQMEGDVILGEVWSQTIGEFYYKHKVHKFSYLYVKTQGLAIGRHGHNESANRGRQTRKVKEWYVFPDGSMHFCGKDQFHQLYNGYDGPIYVLSVKISRNGTR